MYRERRLPARALGRRRLGLFLALIAVGTLVQYDALGAGQWSDPHLIGEDDNYDSVTPGVAVVGDTAIVVWTAFDAVELDGDIVLVEIAADQQSEQRLLHEPNAGMDRISFVSTGSDGVPWVIWERYGDGYEQVVSHRDGTEWTPPETVFSQGGRYDWYGIYAVDSGNVWVARSSRAPEATDRDIFVRHWDGHLWSDVTQMGFPGDNDRSPAVTADAGGSAWVTWISTFPDEAKHRVYASAYELGEWSAPAVVDSSPGNIVMCDMELLPDGRPLAAWSGNGYTSSTDIEYAILGESGWEYGGLINEVDIPGIDTDASARISRNGSGDLWAVWCARDITGPLSEIKAARWNGRGWSSEELVSAPDTAHLSYEGPPEVAVADDGTVWVAWMRMDDAPPWDDDIWASFRYPDTAVDVWGLSCTVRSGEVILEWYVADGYAHTGFHVWRAAESGAAGGGIPADAVRVNQEAIRHCTSCSFTDSSVCVGETYSYWVEQEYGEVLLGPVEVVVSASESGTPRGIRAVRPNPAQDGVRFEVEWTLGKQAGLAVYTAGGRLIRTWDLDASPGESPGTGVVRWDGTDSSGRKLPSGVYFAVLREDGRVVDGGSKTVVILR